MRAASFTYGKALGAIWRLQTQRSVMAARVDSRGASRARQRSDDQSIRASKGAPGGAWRPRLSGGALNHLVWGEQASQIRVGLNLHGRMIDIEPFVQFLRESVKKTRRPDALPA